MSLNPREKIIAICVGAAVGLYALDQVLLEPYVERLNTAQDQIEQRQTKVIDANDTIRSQKQKAAEWKKVSAGRMLAGRQAAEAQLLSLAQDCGADANLTISTYKPDKIDSEKGFDRILLRVTGVGSMQQVGRFLFAVEHASTPVKITDLQINARKDGTDDLTMSVGLTTIYQGSGQAKLASAAFRTEGLQ